MSNQIIVYTGSNKYQIDREINELIEKHHADELSLVKYDSEEVVLDEILNDCETLPFLSDKKIVIINNPVFLSSEKSKMDHNIERFSKYIENPNETTILVINSYNMNLDKKRKINKLILEKAKVLNFDNITEIEAMDIIKKRMKDLNVSIKDDAVQMLIFRTECDALKLYSELDKLTFYVEEGQEIKVEDIKLLVCEPLENNIFNLTNNIIERNIEKSIQIYHKLLTQNEEPIVFSAILGKNFHHLYMIKQYQKKFYNEFQLKNVLKIHPYQLKKLFLIAQKTKEEDLIKNIQAFSQYDLDVKTGKVDKYLGFELLILNMSY